MRSTSPTDRRPDVQGIVAGQSPHANAVRCEPLELRYQKAPYGPYAENLRHVLNHIEGHFITGYGDAEDRPDKLLELIVTAAQLAESFLRDHPETDRRFDRVVDLIEGFETPFGMELLSTVH